MLTLGCHLSASAGYLHMGQEAISIGANTFQFFTRNPRGGTAKPLDLSDVAAYLDFASAHGIGQIVAHAPYTLNGCSADPAIRDFARRTMLDDLQRLDHLPGNLYNFHPGSHVKQGVEVATEQICDMLNAILWQDMKTTVLLETMAGKGSEVGRNFEELERVIELVDCKDKIGVCFDTCHTWDGGYDLVEDLDGVLRTFDQIIGLDRLKAVHLNDSMNVRDSHKDRHQKIGEGEIGAEALKRIVTHPLLAGRPFILETPNDDAGYAREIAMIKSWADESME